MNITQQQLFYFIFSLLHIVMYCLLWLKILIILDAKNFSNIFVEKTMTKERNSILHFEFYISYSIYNICIRNIFNHVSQLENHFDEDICERSGAVVTRTISIRRDQGGWTEYHGITKLVAAERDYNCDVSDHESLPDTLRNSRFLRELPSQETASNTIGAVKSCLLIVTEYISLCNRV